MSFGSDEEVAGVEDDAWRTIRKLLKLVDATGGRALIAALLDLLNACDSVLCSIVSRFDKLS